MEPRIQYAKTADGVSIAFWTLGDGPPLVWMPSPPFSHIQLEWEWPLTRRTYEKLAERRRLIRYDCRGSGLSDREVPVSLETHLLDLSAVVDRLALERIDLVAYVDAGPVAIAYAARNAEGVTHLVLWGTYARGGFEDATQVQGLFALLERDWQLFTETMAHATFGWSGGEHASWLAEFWAKSTTPDAVRAAWNASFNFDVTELLSGVLCPTLVLHPSHVKWIDVNQSRLLASQIPRAQLTVLDDLSGVLLFDETGTTVSAIEAFLCEGEHLATTESPPPPSAFRTVLFTDLVGHTEMMSRLGDERGRAVLREHERITRDVLKAHGGTEVKTMGDGFMASFGSVTKAVECAIALQRAMDDRNRGAGASHPRGEMAPGASDGISQGNVHPAPVDGSPLRTSERGQTSPPAHPEPVEGRAGHEPLHVRVGLNAGEPIEEDGDLFGATVILAARIAAKAEGGEILVANAVRELCSGKGFLFADRGDFVAKGFEEPVRVYEVRWREEAT